MSVLVAFTVGTGVVHRGWSLGVKAFDAFMLTMLLTLVAATARIMAPALQKILKP